jgi:gliding motility-associated-like protein
LRVSGLTEDCVGNKVQLTTTEPMKRYEWYSSFSEGSVLSNEPTLEVDKSGKYWVKAEVNFGGCVAVDTIDVTFFLPKVDLGPDTSECVGETITLKNKYPGQGTYQWSDNTTEESLDVTTSVNSVDNIWLEITDDRGCSNRDTVVVSALPQPELDLSHVPSGVCYGDTIFNKTTCTKYQWAVNGIENPADTMNYIVVKQSGTYTLTGWNEYGCSITESINVTSLSLPSFDISDKIECPDETETFTGPSGMTSYTWMNGASSKDITLTQPDTLWLEVKDNNGCVYRDSAVYSWYDKPMFQDVSDTSVCVTSDITLKVDAGLNNYQWLFYDGSTLTDLNNNSNAYTITNASSLVHEGDYIVNAADGNGCALSDTMSLDVIDVPALSLGDDRDICEGDTIQIEANPGYTKYNWFKDGVFFSTDQYILVAAPGAYELTAQMSNGCTNKDEVNVGVIKSPKVTLPDDISLCPETPYTINIEDFTSPAGGGIDHLQWNTEETTQSITVQDSGTYSVLAFDNNGCFDYDSIKIEWYTLPEWALDDDTSFCDNSTMILQSPLSAPGDVNSYQWSKYVDGGADIPGPADSDWKIDSEGEYILTIKDKNNCISDDTVSVAELASPSIDLGDNKAACDGDTIVLSVDDQYEIYQWNGDPVLDKPVLPVSTAGDNILTVWNNEGCSDADTVTVNFMPLPVVDLGDDIENCAGIESVLSAPPGMESYLWSTMDTTTSITVYEGNYWLKVKDPNGCANADTIDVIWHPVPEVTLGNDTNICPVDEIILDAGPGFASYEWQTGETTRTKVANFADTVNYVVVSNEYGCYGFDNTMVYLLPAPEYVVSNDTSVCSNDTLVLDAGSDYLIYNWFDGSNDRFYYVSSGGDYWVKVFDGCFWLDDTVKVISYEAPVIANIDTSVYSQIVIFPEGGTEPYQYAINDEPFQDENVYKNLENGLYQVYVKDANSCMDEDTVRLSGSGEVVVPNFFTPNGDGTNDTWQIKGIDKFPESEIRIYDRYGKLLVKYKGMEQGWDGRYLNKPLPSDDYWYVIRLVPIEKIIKGHVTLKR